MLVVQIWIMHIKCPETQLMYKKAKRTRNNSKISTILLFGLICPCKKISRRRQCTYVVSHTEVTSSLSEPRAFLSKAPVCKKLTPKLVPIRPKNLPQHLGSMSWHHAMFHDFQACFRFKGIKKPSFSIFPASHDTKMFEFHSHFLHGTYKFTQGHSCDFSTNLIALEHVLVVQIWFMHI